MLALLAVFNTVFAAENSFFEQVSLSGNFYVRNPRSVTFERWEAEDILVADSLLTVRSSVQVPLATDSAMTVGSHTITFFPGAMIRLLKNGIYPVAGRLKIVSAEASEPLNLFARKFSGAITDGTLLIEVTPDNGIFVKLENNGAAWFKDLGRNIFELNHSQQLHFQMFGETLTQSNPSGFWSGPPGSFSSLRPKFDTEPALNDQDLGGEDVRSEESSEDVAPSPL